jgi:hypothetical protein
MVHHPEPVMAMPKYAEVVQQDVKNIPEPKLPERPGPRKK